jgi:hypothetical protein
MSSLEATEAATTLKFSVCNINKMIEAWLYCLTYLTGFILIVVAYNHWPKSQTTIDVYRPKVSDVFDYCHVNYSYVIPEPVVSINVVYAVSAALLIGFGTQMFYATDAFGTGAYSKELAKGWNPYKFMSGAVTTGIISTSAALLINTRDAGSLMSIALASLAIQFIGYSNESSLRGHGAISAHVQDSLTSNTIVWWILFASIWSPIIFNLYNLHVDNSETGNRIAGYQWYILLMQLLYYIGFGVIQILQYKARLSGNTSYKFKSTESQWNSLSLFQNISIASSVLWALVYEARKC